MKTIKLIELLNKIANNEKIPEQLEYHDHIYTREGHRYLMEDGATELFDCYNFFCKDVLNLELGIYEPHSIEVIEGTMSDRVKVDGTTYFDIPQELLQGIKKLVKENEELEKKIKGGLKWDLK